MYIMKGKNEKRNLAMCLRSTVSAVAWHERPQQMRYDVISIRQIQQQCTKHLAH